MPAPGHGRLTDRLAAAQGATTRPGRGYMVRPSVPELKVMSVTSIQIDGRRRAAVAADDVEDVNLGAVLDVVAVGVEVAGDVERRVVACCRAWQL